MSQPTSRDCVCLRAAVWSNDVMQTAVLPHTGDQIMHAIVWFHGRGLPLSAAKRGSLDSVQSAGSAAERRLSDFDTSMEDAMPTRGGAQNVCMCPKPVLTRVTVARQQARTRERSRWLPRAARRPALQLIRSA